MSNEWVRPPDEIDDPISTFFSGGASTLLRLRSTLSHFVSWSDKDQAFIGYCPALFLGGVCHDGNRIAAYAKLVELVEEDIQSRLEKGENLPEPKNDIWFPEVSTT